MGKLHYRRSICAEVIGLNTQRINYKDLLAKAKMLNACEEVYLFEDAPSYMISLSDSSKLIIVPNEKLHKNPCKVYLNNCLSDFNGNIKVVGYNDKITVAENLFYNLQVKSIDLSELYLPNLEQFINVFNHCDVDKIIMPKMQYDRLRELVDVFLNSEFRELDMDDFDSLAIESFCGMFNLTRANELKIKLSTEKAITAKGMFRGATIKKLDLSDFNLGNIQNLENLFQYAYIGELILGKQHMTNKVLLLNSMFNKAIIPVIDISQMTFDSRVYITKMFLNCEAQKIITGDVDLHRHKSARNVFTGCKAELVTNLNSVRAMYEAR